jgi:DNA-directed RNA polymerase specialized sigma24 family protein
MSRPEFEYRLTDARRELAASGLRYARRAVARTLPLAARRDWDELDSLAALACCRAAATYDPSRGRPFIRHLRHWLRGHLSHRRSRRSRDLLARAARVGHPPPGDPDGPALDPADRRDPLAGLADAEELERRVYRRLHPEHARLVRLKAEGWLGREIAAREGVSVQAVSLRVIKARAKLAALLGLPGWGGAREMSWFYGVLYRLGLDPDRQRRGKYWYGPCPAHESKSGKLKLEAWLTPDQGRLLVGCWSGCDKAAILAAKGVRMSELFAPAQKTAYGDFEARPRRRAVEEFDYADEEGRVLYTVVRYEPKDFRQRRLDPATGREVWGLGDARRVLYRTFELAKRRRDCVWWVEGERKADLLHSLGLLGTCNVGGAGMGWLESYGGQLRGRNVVVVPDNDEAGRRHADRVLGALVRTGAAGVRLALLDGLPEGGDVIDYERQHGRAALEKALRAAGRTWRAE